jgi:hypothetical protein
MKRTATCFLTALLLAPLAALQAADSSGKTAAWFKDPPPPYRS